MPASLCLCVLLSLSAAAEPADAPDALLALSIEQLGDVQVRATVTSSTSLSSL